MKYIIFYYVLAINIVTLVVYGIDKYKAKNDMWRIPELTLMLLAAMGGSVGALGGMFLFRHKTKHLKFIVGVPLILVLQILLVVILVMR